MATEYFGPKCSCGHSDNQHSRYAEIPRCHGSIGPDGKPCDPNAEGGEPCRCTTLQKDIGKIEVAPKPSKRKPKTEKKHARDKRRGGR